MESKSQASSNDFAVEVFFDGDCPLCQREINMLKRWDKAQRIRFTNIAAPDFEPKVHGRSLDDFMARIQGRLPDGTYIEGVEVFRHLYTAVGFGPLVALSRLPLIRNVLDLGYRFFARNRLRFTGRCQDGVCKLPAQAHPQANPQAQA